VTASGPTGEPVHTGYARRGDLAVVELATVCGLLRLPGGRFDPLGATSFGLGEVIRDAVAAGARRVVVGVGGSASTDGGAGMLRALGARVADDLSDVDLSGLALDADVVVASDVDNPLYGPSGAAYVYGPQKGATPDDVAVLDARLRRWGAAVTAATGTDHTGDPGAGAAGGVGYGLVAGLGAHLRSGIDMMLDLIGFADQLDGAVLVITGEGALDEQTLAGKAPAGVAAAARKAGVPVVAVAGRNALPAAALAGAGIEAAYALVDVEPDVSRAIAHAGPLLERVAAGVARRHLPPRSS
jgi:glycerate kinase